MIVARSPAFMIKPSPVPSTKPDLTTILSIDSSSWYVPAFPSEQLLLIVFGAFSSFPPDIVPRPSRRLPEEHSDPNTAHLGAL